MKIALIILGGLFLLLFLITLLRVGIIVRGGAGAELILTLRIGVFRLNLSRLMNRPEKPKKGRKKEPPPTEEPSKEEKQEPKLDLDQIKAYIELACTAAKKLKQAVRIDWLKLRLVFGGAEDAASAALRYGGAAAAAAALLPLMQGAFVMKDTDIYLDVDFESGDRVTYDASISGRIIQLILIGLYALFQFLRIKKRTKTERSEVPA